jgi:hypothetical protein
LIQGITTVKHKTGLKINPTMAVAPNQHDKTQ